VLLVSLSAVWPACERITSALEPSPALTPSDLPIRGQTPLPVLLDKEVGITFKSGLDPVNLRHKADPTPTPQVNAHDLETMLRVLASTLQTPYVAIFGSVDTTSAQWRYAYTALKFDADVVASAGHKKIPFLYTHITSTGMTEIVAAMIPDTPAAHRAMRLWLKAPMSTDIQLSDTASDMRGKGGSGSILNSYACGPEGAYDCAIIVWSEGLVTLYCWPKMCVRAHSNVDEYEDPFAGGGSGDPACRDFPELCAPNAGHVSEIPTYYDCSGEANGLAYWDPVCPARCVGGNTNRRPAPLGADCSKLNLPCAGDPIRNPVLQVPAYCPEGQPRCEPGRSGLAGARFSTGANAVRTLLNGNKANHWGLDIKCRVGEPIYPIRQGIVINTNHQRDATGITEGHGRWVDVEYTNTDGTKFYMRYAHLQEYNFAQVGSVLGVNTPIGYCGKTGNAARDRENANDFSHVHIEAAVNQTFRGNSRTNPEHILATKFDAAGQVVNHNPCND
jgi:hypothetical protein